MKSARLLPALIVSEYRTLGPIIDQGKKIALPPLGLVARICRSHSSNRSSAPTRLMDGTMYLPTKVRAVGNSGRKNPDRSDLRVFSIDGFRSFVVNHIAPLLFNTSEEDLRV